MDGICEAFMITVREIQESVLECWSQLCSIENLIVSCAAKIARGKPEDIFVESCASKEDGRDGGMSLFFLLLAVLYASSQRGLWARPAHPLS